MAGTTPAGRRPAKKAAPKAAAPPAPADSDIETASTMTGPVVLDLDALQKSEVLPDITEEPFTFLHFGRVYSMMDPRDVDWKDILEGVRNPVLFMRLALGDDEEAVDAFIGSKLKGWKLNALFHRWQEHFGCEDLSDLNLLLGGRRLTSS